ncbi:helix-turn-helix domain-containing protein [Metallosphaera javensis (ex Sakai et al. 2022)]|uniref:helix-turn-helix domain-containing protein n=1 Tax=Metallosphaera javensis (ex Sakai et al. 2022) TaxID=2775498 RepID=UPI002588E955|nr:MAG: bacterioopsin transcriptional activator [Metallosphaera javensis (ex Sakai et al. 2022)]
MKSDHTKFPLKRVDMNVFHEDCWTSYIEESVIESLGRVYYPEDNKIRVFMLMNKKDLEKIFMLNGTKIKKVNNISRLNNKFLVDMIVGYRGSILEIFNMNNVLALNMSNVGGREKWSFLGYEYQISRVISDLRGSAKIESYTISDVGNYLNGLTDSEITALNLAFDMGYFEYPKGVKAEELASLLGVKKSTLIYHLRNAERKIIGSFLRKINP